MRHIGLLLCCSLAACATDAVRPTASATMRMTQGLKAEMAAFAERQNEEIDARHRAIAILRQNSQISSSMAARQRMDWRSTKKEAALRLFDEATKESNNLGLAGLLGQDPAKASPASAVAFDSKQYDALLKALKPLGRKRSPLRDAKFLLTFGQSVVETMEADLEAAAGKDEEAGALAPAELDSGG